MLSFLCAWLGCCCIVVLHDYSAIGHDLYGQQFEDFQRILAQLRAKDVEREEQAILNRHLNGHIWPFGGESYDTINT